MMDEWERGWHGSDKFICPECVGDDYLKAVERHCVVDEQECQATDFLRRNVVKMQGAAQNVQPARTPGSGAPIR